MEKTPISNRRTIGIFGGTNAGKSSLFNKLLGQDMAIVSDAEGTTTDPVIKAMELIPYGPITLMDTAGLNDKTQISELRIKAAMKALLRVDLAIYAVDSANFDVRAYEEMKLNFLKFEIPYIMVFTKSSGLAKEERQRLTKCYQGCHFTDIDDADSIKALKSTLCDALASLKDSERSLLGGVVKKGDFVVMVCPIDSAAPAGRMILPQVQLLRDCLDNDCVCIVTKPSELKQVIEQNGRVDLVVTDSQVFGAVSETIPEDMPLTSFSIISARQKGNLDALVKGAKAVLELADGDKVLISEACTHSKTHEDIGTVKIPAVLKRLSGARLDISFSHGQDYPENLADFSLIVHCGACMLTRKTMKNRMLEAELKNVPITNYGIVLALGGGILDRAVSVF